MRTQDTSNGPGGHAEATQSRDSKPAEPLLLKGDDAAAMLGVSKAHFYRMHNAGRIPLPVRLGGAVRWRRAELLAWIDTGMPNRQRWQAMQHAPEGGVR